MTKIWNVSGKPQRVPGFGTIHAGEFVEMDADRAKLYAELDAFSLTDPNRVSEKPKSEPDKDK